MTTFEQPELKMQLKAYQICSVFAYKMMTSKKCDARWDQILLGTSEMPLESVLEGCYRNRLQGSEQLQTVFSMYHEELSRDCVAPSYQKLRSMV